MKKFSINWSLALGTALGALIVLGSVLHSTSTPWIFMNLVGLLIVAGGMTSASLIMYPSHELRDLIRALRQCVLRPEIDLCKAIQEVVRLAELHQEDSLFFHREIDWIENYSVRNAVELLSTGLKTEDLKRRMELMADASLERALSHSGFLLSLAKLGPGFGLLGTLVGLVVLLQDMGAGGNFDRVGPALAISLLATLYGVVFANLILQPISEYIRITAEHSRKMDALIVEGIALMKERRHPIQIRESLKTYLSWAEIQKLEKIQTLQAQQQPPTSEEGRANAA